MAINYSIYTDLDLSDLRQRLEAYTKDVEELWELWNVSDNLGPFHEEVMEEYGVKRGFKSFVFTRHSKAKSVEAREKLLEFFESLPGRKLVRMDDTFIDYKDPGTHREP